MKVFLAGCDDTEFLPIVTQVKHQYALFSYYHWLKKNTHPDRIEHRDLLNSNRLEVICDSGLFTLMFGAGSGKNYDFTFMKEYTAKYLATARLFGINNITIVESDVHKLLGMGAVFELRKLFQDSGMKVLYVWHKEEGIDGLMSMAEKYDYIALSIPELRILFKGQKERYQTVTQQLLQQVRSHVGEDKMPKIHLLGNTVHETMETTLAYSCDSTSWLSGGRFGRAVAYSQNKLKSCHRKSDFYLQWEKEIFPKYHSFVEWLEIKCGQRSKAYEYQKLNLFSAYSYKLYQEFLDRSYPWIGLRRNHGRQDQSHSSTH